MTAGFDEVGRGPWAGPICAAALVLTSPPPAGIKDSKLLRKEERTRLGAILMETMAFGIGEVTSVEIDAMGLGWANREVFVRAALNLKARFPEICVTEAIIDGSPITNPGFNLEYPFRCVIHGEISHKEIAGASIIAKIHRDALMESLEKTHPAYGFASHKGYGTEKHKRALEKLGPIQGIHRMSYAPLRKYGGKVF